MDYTLESAKRIAEQLRAIPVKDPPSGVSTIRGWSVTAAQGGAMATAATYMAVTLVGCLIAGLVGLPAARLLH